jgi:hypothetical protein
MKKILTVFMAVAFLMGFSALAMADVTITGVIDKAKSKVVGEIVTIEKDHEIGVKQIVKPSSSAESQALKNDTNTGNSVTETPKEGREEEPPDYTYNDATEEYTPVPGTGSPAVAPIPVTRAATIDASTFDAAAGVLNVNQAPGSMNNQGNADSLAFGGDAADILPVDPGTQGATAYTGGTFLHAESSAEKINTDNAVAAELSNRTNLIDNAFIGVDGLVGVNQAAGNVNNQNNATALSVGEAIASLSEADLGMTNSGNIDSANWTTTTDSLTNGAFGGASGILGVNQSSGNMNNQANVVAACVGLSYPGTDPNGGVVQP